MIGSSLNQYQITARVGAGEWQGRDSSRPEAGEHFRHQGWTGEDFRFRAGEAAEAFTWDRRHPAGELNET